jgi:tagatose-1,6-bisphosphate aldolase non-catalytic subunit AgaZ/GatZ
MSEEIVTAALREAAAESFVPMFIATPRQVDADRGYTGWSQRDLRAFIERTADREGYDGPAILARDHGGPYQSMRDRGDDSVDPETAMEYAKELFYDDLEAGFDVLHVDATEDATADEILPLSTVADRTVELIESIERERRENGYDPVYYEVGTEEISGGMTDAESFEQYVELLVENLANEGLEDVQDRLLFIVGQVGTTMRIDMTNEFDPDQASTLVERAGTHGLYLKTHYTDWLDDSTLSRFPELGIGGANVGPEFAAAIVDALADLTEREREIVASTDDVSASGFMETFEDATIEDETWKKFAPDNLDDDERASFIEENRRNIATCVGRYVFTDPAVVDAREQLYETIETHTEIDPDEYVVDSVQSAIDRYVDAFNLSGSAAVLEEAN